MTQPKTPKEMSVDLPLVWPGADMPLPVRATNFVVQPAPDGNLEVTFGHAAPLLVGSGAEQLAQAQALRDAGGCPVKIVARVALSVKTAKSMMGVLASQLQGLEGSQK